jgi:ABC-type lipoprotein export system ATPase subunit
VPCWPCELSRPQTYARAALLPLLALALGLFALSYGRTWDTAQAADLVGLAGRANHRPYELSGGEQQRVALARALANRPAVLIADEPTGQLDSATGRTIMRLVQALVSSEGMTAIVATHDQSLIDVADRVVELRDGRIVHDAANQPASDRH